MRKALAAIVVLIVAGCGCRAEAGIPAREREALIALYAATRGDSWKRMDGWIRTDRHEAGDVGTECSWDGVTCDDAESHVTKLELDDNNLVGGIPPQIAALSRLTELHAAGNRLSGALPGSLFTLTRLRLLDLSRNALGGAIPDAVGRLASLETLHLEDNFLGGSIPPSVVSCRNLKGLVLARNRLSGAPPASIGDLRRLESLDLSGNRLTGALPDSWGGLEQLIDLDVSSNRLAGGLPEPWSRLRKIQMLDARDNAISGPMPRWLFALPKLMGLRLSHNRLTGEWALPDGKPGGLGFLDISYNALTGPLPARLDRLTDLRVVNIAHNAFSGPLPICLFEADSLKAAGNRFSGLLPRVKRFPVETDLSDNLLEGTIEWQFDASRVRFISLARNRFTGPLPLSLLRATPRSLDLSGNAFTGRLPERWRPSKELRILNLSHNALDGRIPAGLFAAENLLWIDLSSNRLAGPVPAASDARALQVLRLGSNRLSGTLPVSAEATPYLAWLSVEDNLFEHGLLEVAKLASLIAFNGADNPWRDTPDAPRARRLPRRPPANFAVVSAAVLADDEDEGAPDAPVPVRSPGPSVWLEDEAGDQQNYAVTGTVVDNQGAVIAGAVVRVTGDSGFTVETASDVQGRFRVAVPNAGKYTITCILQGFKQWIGSAVVGPGQAPDVKVTLGVARVTETVELSGEALTLVRGWWNTWVSEYDREEEAPEDLEPRNRYQYLLELGSAATRHPTGGAVPIGQRLSKHLASLIRNHRATASLVVRVAVIGRSIRITRGGVSTWDRGIWVPSTEGPYNVQIPIDIRRMAAAQESPTFEGSLPAGNQRFAALRLDIDAVADGCSAITASIWDQGGTVPLDNVVDFVAVGRTGACGAFPAASGPREDLLAPKPGHEAPAALHIVEFTLSRPTAVAVLALSQPQAKCPAYMWQMNGTLSGAIMDNPTFQQMLNGSRGQTYRPDYADVARLLKDVLFTGADAVPGCGAKEALQQLRTLAQADEVEVTVRAIDLQGNHRYPPLGLLSLAADEAGGRMFAHRLVPLEPLPVQSAIPAAPVDDWTFCLPDPLLVGGTGDPSPVPQDLGNSGAVIGSRQQLEDFLGHSRPGPVGLVLLAHHGDGYLSFQADFANDKRVIWAGALPTDAFRGGSVAVLSACATARITNTAVIVAKLNEAGVDSFVMSPFEVDKRFGAALARNIAAGIVAAGLAEKPLTLRQLFRNALRSAQAELEAALADMGNTVEGWASEFVLAGNPDVQLSFTGNRRTGGDK